MYCMHSIPLHNSGEIYNHHLYLLGHTQKQLSVSTAEPFSWVPLEMQQAYAEKRYFFFSFSACMPPHLQASPPISRFQLPISSTEMIKSKQKKKKASFLPPFFFFSWFGRKRTKDRKSMLAICQKVRAQRRGGGLGNGMMVRCQSIIVQNSSPAPITSTTDNCSTSKLFSWGFSQKK